MRVYIRDVKKSMLHQEIIDCNQFIIWTSEFLNFKEISVNLPTGLIFILALNQLATYIYLIKYTTINQPFGASCQATQTSSLAENCYILVYAPRQHNFFLKFVVKTVSFKRWRELFGNSHLTQLDIKILWNKSFALLFGQVRQSFYTLWRSCAFMYVYWKKL